MLVELQKGMLVDKNLSKGKNNFLKNKMSSNAFHSSREMRTQCKSTCEEHAGSDKRSENTTLFLHYLPHKFNLEIKR